jgi:hypothetical protein
MRYSGLLVKVVPTACAVALMMSTGLMCSKSKSEQPGAGAAEKPAVAESTMPAPKAVVESTTTAPVAAAADTSMKKVAAKSKSMKRTEKKQ